MSFLLPAIEGLTALVTPASGNGQIGDKFVTPHDFDKNRLASRWVIDGPEVQEAQQDEVLAYANARAKGWTVWTRFEALEIEDQVEFDRLKEIKNRSQDEEKAYNKLNGKRKKVPYTRVVGKHKFVLMYRPIELQKAINQCYAAESRARVNLELKGETNAANDSGDPGVLSNADLKRFRKLDGEEDQTLPITHMGASPSTAANVNIQ